MKPFRVLFYYGAFLLLCGVLGYMSNPQGAKTALISGGLFGGLSWLSAWLLKSGKSWALMASKVMAAFLAVIFSWRSFVSWMAYFNTGDKLIAAILTSLMLVGTVMALALLIKPTKE